jgi:hypothetical protein
MPFKDPEQRREYQRQRERQRRSGALDLCMTDGVDTENVCPPVEVIRNPDLGTVEGIRQSLNTVAARVLNDESLDSAIQGRTIAGLCTVALRLIEVRDMEERLAAIETQLAQQEARR